jgi:L-alanine-DL-glutamate epimerase-like enolase superfamily enzyme
MKIRSIEMSPIKIPFKEAFSHASKTRLETESVLVKVITTSGKLGLGEGCPRLYVTDESVDSCLDFYESNIEHLLAITNLTALSSWVDKNQKLIDRFPAAWCSLELAILDALAQESNQTVEEFLGISSSFNKFTYTAVIGKMKHESAKSLIKKYHLLGMTSWKIKVSGDFSTDENNLKELSSFLPREAVRLDANNLWTKVKESKNYLEKLTQYFWSVEEPLQKNDLAGMAELSNLLQCPIILDESMIGLPQLLSIDSQNWWIPNVRISKMGGIIRSLEFCKQLASRRFIIGSQVGETSILTRAAMVLVQATHKNLIAQEGAFGTYLLERDIVDPSISFGQGGSIEWQQKGSGFGLALL